MIISLITVVIYTGISLKLSFAKKDVIDENEAIDHILQPKKMNFITNVAKLFPHVTKYAWSTIDLKNLYVR